ncbi:MAG TPA: ABC transporter ATP-binding protein [Terriglobales bacterium]|nr:ABC transporter ATP-binding protein [Terriglobales bacterium]
MFDGPMIELRGLSSRYGSRQVLRQLEGSFSGRVLGLLGPNGAGKSTLIRTLLGFLPPAEGTARILGSDIGALAALRHRIGYMPENDAFVANLSAVTFVRMMGELSGLPAEAALERAHEALFYVGLGEARYRRLGGYSLGMKQLAKLAQAIVHGPELLILDEPTNSLDPPARRRMLELIREIRDSGRVRIVLCSHLLRDVEETCDEVVILHQGRIVHHADLVRERQHLQFLEIEAAGPAEGLAEALRGLGCAVEAGAGRLRVTLAAGVTVRDVYRLADQRQLALRRLQFRRDTLEDIFLQAVGAAPLPRPAATTA